MSKVYYLAGPMSGIPQFNYPEFHRIASVLRDAGYQIESPAELDTPEQQKFAMESKNGDAGVFVRQTGITWGDTLAKDVKLVSDKVDGIIAMHNWYISRGARLEVFVATLVGKPVYVYEGCRDVGTRSWRLRLLDKDEIWEGVSGKTKEKQESLEAVTKRA